MCASPLSRAGEERIIGRVWPDAERYRRRLVLTYCIIKGRPVAVRQGGFFERDLTHHNRTDN